MGSASGELSELSLLRHAHLEQRFDFELDGDRTYAASLSTKPTALAPAYEVHDACGKPIGWVVLPSILQDVELHLLDWITRWDHGRFSERA